MPAQPRRLYIYEENTLILERDESVNPEYPEVRWFFDCVIQDRQSRRCMQIYGGSALIWRFNKGMQAERVERVFQRSIHLMRRAG